MKLSVKLIFFIIPVIADAQSIYDKEGIKTIMDKVNRYQFQNPWKEFDDNWIRGTYYAGVMACYQATGDKNYLEQCDRLGEKLNWQIPVLQPEQKGSGVNLLAGLTKF